MEERDPSTIKIMPHDLQAEKSVLGGLMMENDVLADVMDIISEHDFYSTASKIIFGAITRLIDSGTKADPITIGNAVTSDVGGLVYYSDLMECASSPENIKYHAKIIRAKAIERKIISESHRLIETAYNPTMSTEDILTEAQKTILSLSMSQSASTMRNAHDIAKETSKLIETRYETRSGMVIGVPTGFYELDNMTGGMIGGDLWIVAARPGMGKSAFATDIAFHCALRGSKAAIFSLEMPTENLMIRILSSMSRIDSRMLGRGVVTDAQWPKLTAAIDRIGRSPLCIDDKPNITPSEIMAKCRKLKSDSGLDMVVVDYLQLMHLPGKKNASREQEVAEISRSMKLLAREIGIPVIALSQLNRNLEQRPDKRPNLGDLRESGAIEQDADLVAFIYRDEMYHDDSAEKGIAEIIIGKHRNGPTGTVKLTFQSQFTRFENMAYNTMEV